MDEAEFYTLHGYRFCFYLVYNVASFIPIVYMKYTDTESQHRWNLTYELLLCTAVFVPFVIEGLYMRKNCTTYRSTKGTIRSFFLAPIIGLTLTLTVPFVYLLV